MSFANINTPTNILAATSTTGSRQNTVAGNTLMVCGYNAGPNNVFVSTSNGSATVVFPVAGTPQNGTMVPAGSYFSATKSQEHDTLNAICANAGENATVYFQFTTGE